MTQRSFTGRSRRRATSKWVRFNDAAAKTLITVGGVGTIIAIALVCLFLVSVVIPLFTRDSIQPVGAANVAITDSPDATASPVPPVPPVPPVHLEIDDYQILANFYSQGRLKTLRLQDGKSLADRKLFENDQPVCHAFAQREGHVAFGFADGKVRLARLAFKASFIDPELLPAELRSIAPGRQVEYGGGLLQRTPEGQLREQKLQVELEEPLDLATGSPLTLIDLTIRSDGPVLAALCEDGLFRIRQANTKKNLLTGKITTALSGGQVQIPPHPGKVPPRWLMLGGVGDTAYVLWADGSLIRIDTRDPESPKIVETLNLLGESNAQLTAATFLIGKTTLVIGDSLGRVRCWFRTKPENARTADGSTLVLAHELPANDKVAVTSLAVSARTRKFAAGFADGSARLYHATSSRLIAQAPAVKADPILALALSPKEDGLITATSSGIARWSIDAPHPEAGVAAIFLPVWYEGANHPEHVWQSSSGTDDFEPKFGLLPLVFGTLKATIYCMLFGVPIAILAAIYSSEFLRPAAKARVKPTIELMASLPSVVLGFLAALVFAPFVEDKIPYVLVSFVTVPVAILMGAYLWQLLPEDMAIKAAGYRLYAMMLTLPAGVLLSALVGGIVERRLFWVEKEGRAVADIRGWLSGVPGADGAGGWMLILLPLCAVGVSIFVARFVTPYIRTISSEWTRAKLARVDLLKFLFTLLATFALTWLIAKSLAIAGFDPRGSVVDTYVQRNALIVGFVMGFAVIPIIYTIAEDALTAVPGHLRAASLGAGATPWQTAVRIVIPTAMSGLFSAVMVGFGRAIGETMVVLMAAGNTPVLEWNIFNGFRTLSANIAVELPEAVRDSTHYRMLFLAALVLFVITFVLNTAAERVRMRFRKRAYAL